jgi:hypothetical protein
MKPINVTTTKDIGDDHPACLEEFWEITQCFGLVRTRIKTKGVVTYEGAFFIGNFASIDEAMDFLKQGGRSILDQTDPTKWFIENRTHGWIGPFDTKDAAIDFAYDHLESASRFREKPADFEGDIDHMDREPTIVSFTAANDNWVSDAEVNEMFVRAVENSVNQKLRSRGHMFLNEVLDLLGSPRTRDGATYGWLTDDDDFVQIRATRPNESPNLTLEINPAREIHRRI